MSTCLPPKVRGVHAEPRAGGLAARAGALVLPLLLLPLLAACGSNPLGVSGGTDATIYAANRTGVVTAIDASNGAVLWQNRGDGATQMAVDRDHHTLFLTSTDGTVAALDGATGKLDWRYTIKPDALPDKPYLVGSMVIVAAHQILDNPQVNSEIVSLDAGSGALLWRAPLPGLITGDLDIHNDQLYASVNPANGSPGAVYALRTTDGTRVWRAAAPTALAAGPASDQTQVYVPTNAGSALALRASDGALLWRQNISASGPLSAIFANSTAIYVGDASGTMHALSKADGAQLWTRAIADTRDAVDVPSLRLFTPSDGGAWVLVTSATSPFVDALSSSGGSVVWSQEAGEFSGITQPPAVLGDNVYLIITPGDEIAAYSLAHGDRVADYPFVLDSHTYTPAQQADLGSIASIVVAPPRVLA